jgi:hypothetical protein
MFDGFLQALGLMALLLAGAAGWLFWHFKRRIKRWHHYGLAASLNRFPGRIRLRSLPEFRWLKGGRAAQRTDAFRAAGFVDLAGFAIDELPDARLFVLHHPEHRWIAVVHEQDELGTWSDLLLFKNDEDIPTLISSILKPAHLHLLPGDPKIHRPGGSESELLEAARQAAGRDPIAGPATPEAFQARFEAAFATAVDGRLLQPLEDFEIRRLVKDRLASCSEDLSDTDFAGLKSLLPEVINNELRLVCSAQFLRETTLAASDWKQARGRLAIIHDRTPLHQLVGRLVYGVFWTNPLKKKLRRARGQRGTPREAFAKLNALLPPWERYRKIGEVRHPVPADIYRAPLEKS